MARGRDPRRLPRPSYRKLCTNSAAATRAVADSRHAFALQILPVLRARQLHDARRPAARHQVEAAGVARGRDCVDGLRRCSALRFVWERPDGMSSRPCRRCSTSWRCSASRSRFAAAMRAWRVTSERRCDEAPGRGSAVPSRGARRRRSARSGFDPRRDRPAATPPSGSAAAKASGNDA